MGDFEQTLRKYEAITLHNLFDAFFGTGKALIMRWLPFLCKNPRMIRFLPQWFFSFRPGAAPFKDGLPSIPFEAAEWLDSFLTKDMIVFEWGSGGSTPFIAKRVKKIVSVEHDPEWYILISQLLKKNGISNCQYLLKEPKMSGNNSSDLSNPKSYLSKFYKGFSFEDYCKAIEFYPDNFFDLVFIDGRARPSCISHAFKKIRPSGYLLLDDSNSSRYAKGIELLKEWKRKDFFGPKPYVRQFVQTMIWKKIS